MSVPTTGPASSPGWPEAAGLEPSAPALWAELRSLLCHQASPSGPRRRHKALGQEVLAVGGRWGPGGPGGQERGLGQWQGGALQAGVEARAPWHLRGVGRVGESRRGGIADRWTDRREGGAAVRPSGLSLAPSQCGVCLRKRGSQVLGRRLPSTGGRRGKEPRARPQHTQGLPQPPPSPALPGPGVRWPAGALDSAPALLHHLGQALPTHPGPRWPYV